jgi:hypothetical protein
MGPRSRRFWLPLARLSAFFGAVVVAGNLSLEAVRPPPRISGPVGREVDFYTRQKRKLDRNLRRFERLFDVFAPAPEPARPEPEPAGEPGAALPSRPAPLAYLQPEPLPALLQEPELNLGLPAGLSVEPVPFPWLETDAAPAPMPVALGELPDHADLTALALDWRRLHSPDPVADVCDGLLKGPELLLDGALSLASDLFPRRGTYSWRQDAGDGIASRLLDLDRSPRQGRIFSDFVGRLVEREQRFFSKFEDSYLNTPGVEDGTADVDRGDLADEQRKIVWDTLRKTYYSKYKFKAEERIRDEAFYFNQWRGMDFVVLPPLMAGYLFYRGYDKKISIGETWLRVSLEPIRKWAREDELLAGLSVEWMVKGFPVGLVVAAGLDDGDPELDFIGIGTSVGMAKKTLVLQRKE